MYISPSQNFNDHHVFLVETTQITIIEYEEFKYVIQMVLFLL